MRSLKWLDRSWFVLSQFRRCYMRIRHRSPSPLWLHYDPLKWRETLGLELGIYPPLSGFHRELEQSFGSAESVSRDELRYAIRMKAEACFQLLWTSCTRSEKLVLIHLAQEGIVNPQEPRRYQGTDCERTDRKPARSDGVQLHLSRLFKGSNETKLFRTGSAARAQGCGGSQVGSWPVFCSSRAGFTY